MLDLVSSFYAILGINLCQFILAIFGSGHVNSG
jgi:hypothetical protein